MLRHGGVEARKECSSAALEARYRRVDAEAQMHRALEAHYRRVDVGTKRWRRVADVLTWKYRSMELGLWSRTAGIATCRHRAMER